MVSNEVLVRCLSPNIFSTHNSMRVFSYSNVPSDGELDVGEPPQQQYVEEVVYVEPAADPRMDQLLEQLQKHLSVDSTPNVHMGHALGQRMDRNIPVELQDDAWAAIFGVLKEFEEKPKASAAPTLTAATGFDPLMPSYIQKMPYSFCVLLCIGNKMQVLGTCLSLATTLKNESSLLTKAPSLPSFDESFDYAMLQHCGSEQFRAINSQASPIYFTVELTLEVERSRVVNARDKVVAVSTSNQLSSQ